ncbi:MAG: polysaccharide deacetylase family protein [Alphaproteobacteria bacterium]|nr:polysaccharide deacetylase family protein [Alphaproteobacteria bacterium]
MVIGWDQRRHFCAAFAVLAGLAAAAIPARAEPIWGGKTPVLLTIDVEAVEDIETLTQLDLQVPATYFMLGWLVEMFPDFARGLAEKGALGSHGFTHDNATELTPERLATETDWAINAHRTVLGRAPDWYRAPYLATNETVEATLARKGFSYTSSGLERWNDIGPLTGLPISQDDILASDYDLFTRLDMSDSEVLDWLKRGYETRRRTGRPFVILLHPSVIGGHPSVLADFIAHVEAQDGVFLSADAYMAGVQAVRSENRAAWISLAHGPLDPEHAARSLTEAGIGDAFLMARSPEGEDYTQTTDGESRFESMLSTLKQAGIKVHAWLPVLKNDTLVRAHPDWAMRDAVGAPLADWLSPHHPDARRQLLDTVKRLAADYALDGLHLDYIRYPGLNAGFSAGVIERFLTEHDLSADLTPTQILADHFVTWTVWRADAIAGLVEEIKSTLPDGVLLSAALLGEAATDFRARDAYAQDYARLAPALDIVLPMAYNRLVGEPAAWIDRVQTQARYQVGRTPIWTGIEAYQEPGLRRITPSDVAASLARAEFGSEGVSIYAYPFSFAASGGGYDLPPSGPDAFRR